MFILTSVTSYQKSAKIVLVKIDLTETGFKYSFNANFEKKNICPRFHRLKTNPVLFYFSGKAININYKSVIPDLC